MSDSFGGRSRQSSAMQTDLLGEQLKDALGDAYVIVSELRGGGMARVFVAQDTRLGRDVVVKVLTPDLAWGVSAARFAREIRVAAQLQEPHIVPVLNAGETAQGIPFYTMPFVRGESLRNRMRGGRLPTTESVAILRDVAKALAYAHAHGVVHRDIKPENVLLSSGTAVVTDFGIAKAISASRVRMPPAGSPIEPLLGDADDPFVTGGGFSTRDALTGTGSSLGTPAYMAPEQAVGDGVAPSADVYAWGVMAYELLAGSHPFAHCKTAQQLVGAHLVETPASLESNADLPAALAALVTRCLAKTPTERPQSGGELVEALNATGTDHLTTTQSLRGHHVVRRRALAWAAAGLSMAVLVPVADIVLRARSVHAATTPLVAVLPIESSGPVGDTTFAPALQEAVSGKLARLTGLRVIDQGSVAIVRRTASTPQQIGRDLGADYVFRAVVHWVRAADGRARTQVTPALIRVADGTTTWAGDPEEVNLADPFAVQNSLATHVAEKLSIALAPRERDALTRRSTTDTAALAAYTRGMEKLRQQQAEYGFGAPLQVRAALSDFERAYTLDSMYADAYASAGKVLTQLIGARLEQAATMDSAFKLGRRALAINPAQPVAIDIVIYQLLSEDKPEEARRIAEQAVRENPSDVGALRNLFNMQQYYGDTAVWTTAQQAVRVAPRNADALNLAAFCAMGFRRYDDAERWIRQILAMDPQRLVTWNRLATLGERRGDTALVDSAMKQYRAHGGRVAAAHLNTLLAGSAALRREIESTSLERLAATTLRDSVMYYDAKATLRERDGDRAGARPYVDSAIVLLRRAMAAPKNWPKDIQREVDGFLALHLAEVGDRSGALEGLARFADDPAIRAIPNGADALWYSTWSAEVYAYLGDVDRMLPELRRLLSTPFGLSVAQVRKDPAYRPYLADPRVRQLLASSR